MGYAGKLKEKKLALKLRKKGLSYREIKKSVLVSKSTLSLWCRDVALSVKQMENLQKKKLKGAERGRIIGAKKQQKIRIAKIEQLLKQGRREISSLTKRERFLIGVALYAADGTKLSHAVEFTNSNSAMIKFMVGWLEEFCNTPVIKMRGTIWIHRNRDEKNARKFWSKLTGIPLKNFYKSYVVENKEESRKIRNRRHKYGVFKVRVFDVSKLRRIKGWISGIFER